MRHVSFKIITILFLTGFAVVPTNHKIPVITDWPNINFDGFSCDIADEFYSHARNAITGFGIIIGGPNRQLSCMDIDSNDKEPDNKYIDSDDEDYDDDDDDEYNNKVDVKITTYSVRGVYNDFLNANSYTKILNK